LYELLGSTNSLYKIDPANGNRTFIGDSGIGDTRLRGLPGDLAIGPDGTLYGVAVKLIWPAGYNIDMPEYDGSWLYKFDKNTGLATPIGNTGYGPIGLSGGTDAIDGLAFLNGTLYATAGNSLLTVDTKTGKATYSKTLDMQIEARDLASARPFAIPVFPGCGCGVLSGADHQNR
jgi:hypothetical protein